MADTNQTVIKAAELLRLFLTHHQLSLPQAVKLSGQPKTSVHRMLSSLEETGFLRRTDDGVYELGFVFLQFGHAVADRLDIRQLSLPVMQKLVRECGEAANLIVRDGNEAIYVEKVDTTEPIRVYTAIGRRAPLYAGACPRVLLTFMPDDEREAYLREATLEPIADNTCTDVEQLRERIAIDRANGYTVSHSELYNYTSAVGAPIFDYSGKVVAGLSIVGPENRYRDDQLPFFIEKTVAAAKEISCRLGWHGAQKGDMC
ncbi:IclR family transcriptional regulator [Brevibacillus sp. TJ4]|uniref:IclR family transcriptional regulator n=1 Tax=Brevibacillus sp. TJ4 TaxID=3234853 RepID=UPI003BA3CE76